MREDRIDIQKSVALGRVIRNSPWFAILKMHVTNVILVCTGLLLAAFYFYFQFREGNKLFTPSIILVLALVVAALLVYAIINIDRLQKIKGRSKQKNHHIILKIAKKLGWNMQYQGEAWSILYPPVKWYSPNRQVVVICEDEYIWLNAISFGVHDYKSPVFWFENRKLERMLIEQFKMEVEEETPSGIHYL